MPDPSPHSREDVDAAVEDLREAATGWPTPNRYSKALAVVEEYTVSLEEQLETLRELLARVTTSDVTIAEINDALGVTS